MVWVNLIILLARMQQQLTYSTGKRVNSSAYAHKWLVALYGQLHFYKIGQRWKQFIVDK